MADKKDKANDIKDKKADETMTGQTMAGMTQKPDENIAEQKTDEKKPAEQNAQKGDGEEDEDGDGEE